MKLVIAASGHTVWDDLLRLGFGEKKLCDVMAVNDMIIHLPYPLDHVYSNDFDMLDNWLNARRPNYKKLDGKIRKHCCFPCSGAEIWPKVPGRGTSSLAAVHVGLQLGYKQIILCGVPLDNKGHYFDPPWNTTNFEREVPSKRDPHRGDQLKFWKDDELKGKVFSMSGRTMDVLGLPPSL